MAVDRRDYWDDPNNRNSRRDEPGPDVLDERRDVLYCSWGCARAEPHVDVDGYAMRLPDHADLREIDPDEYDQSHWGALCPVCDLEYHSFG